MKKISILFPVLAILLVIASCSKEKKVEHRLVSKNGKWRVTEQTSDSYQDGQLQATATYQDVGGMVFKKDGNLVWTGEIAANGSQQTGTWSNTEEDILMTFDGTVTTFHIVDQSRRNMTLENTTSYVSGGSTYMNVLRFTLEKG